MSRAKKQTLDPAAAPRAQTIFHKLEQDADLFAGNSAYLCTLYESFLHDTASVPSEWRQRFKTLADGEQGGSRPPRKQYVGRIAAGPRQPVPDMEQAEAAEFPARVLYLIHAYRVQGHMHARIDPLNLEEHRPNPELGLKYHGLSENDLDKRFPTGDLAGPPLMRLRDIYQLLQQTYCGPVGPEFMHITDSAQKLWLQQRLESSRSAPVFDSGQRRAIFGHIMRATEFEHFLQTRYTGQKRFSIEGGESLIPLLDALIRQSGVRGAKEIIIGMAHRGRLNVLANIMGKSLGDIFAEFEGAQFGDTTPGSGDVKHHLGYSSDFKAADGSMHLSLAFNPSHLEIITPVVLGSVRARQCRRRDKARRSVTSIIVHGDAAFAGQGVVAESLNLSKLTGFRTGGTVHVVINNQIGFTTNPYDSRSTLYCTDIAKMVQAPIFHVNGDDPEAVVMVAQLAVDYRHKFRSDVVIDMICYRRYGHNEADTPAVTQPLMYRKIDEHPNVHQRYREKLVSDGVLSDEEADAMIGDYRRCLDDIRRGELPAAIGINSLNGRWAGFVASGAEEPETGVDGERLAELAQRAHSVPAGFTLHGKVRKIYDQRVRMMAGELPVDWGCAEVMAYASLVADGHGVRISGQDTGRGTFFHRHAIVYDQISGKSFMPLKQLENGPLSHFLAIDSMLSEQAIMAFEYGYSVAEPRALVIWEAQYGDFANNAQGVIDQFICAGEAKWRRMSGLVLWLPHGQEGQGPEHSSARLERYLQLCAEENMQVVYPTTPAQLFHLLRRQLLIRTRKPLIMMAPKSMLRRSSSFSTRDELEHGRFVPLLPEQDRAIRPRKVRRLLLCAGKVYYDLLAERQKHDIDDVAMVRIERLYPFPVEALKSECLRYATAAEVVWVQEEPLNQGAWHQIRHHVKACLARCQQAAPLARREMAAPAVGSARRHAEQLRELLDRAFGDNAINDQCPQLGAEDVRGGGCE